MNSKAVISANEQRKNNGYKEREKHLNWKGGSYLHGGYRKLLIAKKTYKSEHIIIMEEHLGRAMLHGEVVHHENGIRDDNRLENLRLMTNSDHLSLHQAGKLATEETKAKMRKMRAGTNQKEAHNQWRDDITKERIIKAIEKSRTFAEVAKLLNINIDTLRARRKHYNIT